MRFDQIDLPSLPAPDVVETIDYEELLRLYLNDVVARGNDVGIDLSRAVTLETSPTNIISQALAYAEMVLRQRVNAAARAVMLSSALDADLDHLGSLFGTARMFGVDGSKEDDERFRRRIQLALEAFSTAGPYGAYVYHALKASIRVKDAAPYGPESGLCTPGQALVVVLSTEGNGIPTIDLINQVKAQLNENDIRPLTDQVIVRAPNLTNYSVNATIYVGRGPDPNVVKEAAEAAVEKYVTGRHMIGRIVAESAIKSALHVGGVERAVLHSMSSDIVPGAGGVAYCTGIQIAVDNSNDDA